MATILESTTTNNSNPTVTNENHRGLLLRPSILASSAASTQAYHRAALIREGFLCEDLGAPPANAVADRLDSLGDLSSLSNRERLTAMTDAPACISCHQRLNPIGFAFEGFDQLGAVRDVETVFANNSPTGTHPLDLLVGDTFLADQSGQSLSGVNGPQEIVDAVAFGVAGRACFAEKLYKFLRAREFTEHDYCALSEIEKTLGNENSILEAVVLSIGTEDIFWRAKGE